jgi:hypothetical protein
MARYTSAYSSFVNRMGEVELLCRFAFKKERHDPVNLRNEVNALCRGAIVLLSSHLEAFIKELGELALDSMYEKTISRSKVAPRFFYHISKKFINDIHDASDPDKKAEKVFSFIDNDIDYWSKTGPFPTQIQADRFNEGFSNPSHNKVRVYFKRFGYYDYNYDLSHRLSARHQPTINMVDHLVDTRNKIAHGDPLTTKTPTDVRDMKSIIQCYCMETDSVFANWWKSQFCSIR